PLSPYTTLFRSTEALDRRFVLPAVREQEAELHQHVGIIGGDAQRRIELRLRHLGPIQPSVDAGQVYAGGRVAGMGLRVTPEVRGGILVRSVLEAGDPLLHLIRPARPQPPGD